MGNAGVGHTLLFVITFPVGISFEDNLVAHMFYREGAFLVAALKVSQYTYG